MADDELLPYRPTSYFIDESIEVEHVGRRKPPPEDTFSGMMGEVIDGFDRLARVQPYPISTHGSWPFAESIPGKKIQVMR